MDDDASIHDRLLWAIHMSGFDDLVKFLASAQSEQQWSMHVLEIITLMFRDQVRLNNWLENSLNGRSRCPGVLPFSFFNPSQTPESLVSAGHARSAEEKLRDSQELESLRQKEQAEKRSRTFQRGTRYNQTDGLCNATEVNTCMSTKHEHIRNVHETVKYKNVLQVVQMKMGIVTVPKQT